VLQALLTARGPGRPGGPAAVTGAAGTAGAAGAADANGVGPPGLATQPAEGGTR
jgi:hypothetical protein